jgi:hypothetical protein
MIRLGRLLDEYTDKEKQTLGIPIAAVARGGKWFIGDKYAGRVVNKQFVPTQSPEAPSSSAQTTSNKSDDVRPPMKVFGKDWRNEVETLFTSLDLPSQNLNNLSPDVEINAMVHSLAIETDPDTLDAVGDWMSHTVWGKPEVKRNKIFNLLDNVIKKNKLKVKTKTPLHRGIHFSMQKAGLATTLLETCGKIGSTFTLPPSGFSLNARKALTFSGAGYEGTNIMFTLLPKQEGIDGMHIHEIMDEFRGELEVITQSSTYKVIRIIQQEVLFGTDMNNPSGGSKFMNIHIEQVADVNESTIQDSPDKAQKTLNLVFADSMKNTAKNLQRTFK